MSAYVVISLDFNVSSVMDKCMRYIDFMIMTWFAVDSIHHYIP